MKNILNDIQIYISSLTIIDILFLISMLVLIILIVALIYIIRMNNDDTEVLDEIKEDKTLSDDIDLVAISKEIDESEPKPIILNDYEKEQEEKAIISYDELLARTGPIDIGYIKESDINGLKVKSVDLESITKPIELPKIKQEESINITKPINTTTSNVLISYEKEEAFLEALKKLQKLLN